VDRTESLRTIFHEYVHLLVDNVSPDTPLWLNEGLAEYYSTFRVVDGGRRALVGQVIPSHRRLLRERRFLTIPDLLGVERASPDYNEGERRSLFYAQSWALVHMLLSRPPGRASQLEDYARLVSDGAPSLDAWRRVFDGQNVARELERYVAESITADRYPLGRIAPATTTSSAVAQGDVQAVLGDLLRRVAPPEEAAAHLAQAVALRPPSARARALYGLLLIDLSRRDEAQSLLLEAAQARHDWLAQYDVAVGLTRLVAAAADPDRRVMATARDALERVRAVRPDLANLAALGARLDARRAI
jgi:tetratricopeptide (TPR) repeat protein